MPEGVAKGALENNWGVDFENAVEGMRANWMQLPGIGARKDC